MRHLGPNKRRPSLSRPFCLAIVFVLIVMGCATDVPDLTEESVRNTEYRIDHVDGRMVRLEGGRYTDRESRLSAALWEQIALGDVNGDGVVDAAAVLATNTGGSGVFVDLAVVINERGKPVHETSLFLGDRVKPNQIRIEDGKITLDMTVHGDADPLCCPTEKVTRTYRLADGSIAER